VPALEDLVVLDRLEVGPPRVEPERVVTPYRVVAGGEEHTTELTYRWESPVFDPEDPASINLAAMVTAQVALNYGLFCSEIVFRGPFDRHDKRFLEDAARNTAREIYVKKLLEPNPFLVGPAVGLEAERRSNYLQARLVFPDPEAARGAAWDIDPSRAMVLSSGGKESLLSHGLLTELGCDVHPVFVNESGRHWFTALNAYRRFDAEVPNTARVWSNCDRLFGWMLRRLPFIRRDFADVRADDYPIRLWTVAVFLFGVLPLARARGGGRLVIGDEYDTSRRTSHRGIPHYDGLYDQSRWFDAALSRYFRRKGWGVHQLSLLRQLSELLVEKILVERYPDLQRLQVSCHAAHTEGEVVRPCGKCEKCRRVVGMLTALGADPRRCGYDDGQIASCLARLGAGGLHQEAEGEAQMLRMLAERGALPETPDPLPEAHPEVLSVRIDRERSPLDVLPTDLRRPLLGIYLEHADGAVRRSGRVWVPTDALDDASIDRPCPFEPRRSDDDAATAGRYLLGELTWPEAQAHLARVDVALLPVGAIEQHGPHLTLDTDAWDADHLCREVAAACSVPRPLVLPLIPYGVSYHHDDFPGTLSVSNDALAAMVYDIGMSCARNGVTKLIIVNGHGGNAATLQFAAQKINRDANIFTAVDTGETSDADLDELCETPGDVHAGEIETSTSLATRPELVRMDRAEPFVPAFSSRYLDFSARRSVEWYARTARISPSGVLGDPTRASAEKGRKMWDLMVRHLVHLVEDLKGLSLDEIYERRY
jgi:creatinine amidohydrolase/Fe(II)-dependent formamide hydrolase-like protein